MHNRGRITVSLRALQTCMDDIEKQYAKKHPYINQKRIGIELKGNVNHTSLQLSLIDLVERHEILRSYKMPSNPTFGIYSTNEIAKNLLFKYLDISDKNLTFATHETPAVLKSIGDDFFSKPFNYNNGPLWRAMLIKKNTNEFLFLIVFHNIIIDEQSINIILHDLSVFYNQHEINKKPNLPTIPSLSDINLMIPENVKNERLKFWKKELENSNPIQLIPDNSSQHRFPFPGNRITNKLPTIYSEKIKAVYGNYSDEHIYLASIFILLHLLTHEDDLCVGITAANRKQELTPSGDLTNLANAFIQCAPLRTQLSSNFTFENVLRLIANKHTTVLNNLLPIDLIQSQAMPRNRKNLLFACPYNIIVSVNSKAESLDFANTHSAPVEEIHNGWSKMDTLGINIRGDEITIEYNSRKFNNDSMQLLYERLVQILEIASTFTHQKIENYHLLLPSEIEAIKHYNNTAKPNISDLYLHEYLQKVASTHPEKPAIVSHDNEKETIITYAELDRLSTILANSLTIARGERVGIVLPRSINFFIAIFAVMKAGGVFVSLGLNVKAIDKKLSLANARFVIAQDEEQKNLSSYQCILLESDHRTIPQRFKTDHLYRRIELTSSSPAYIMFTSGTTGKTVLPKGVLCTHGGLRNLYNHMLYNASHLPIESIITTSPIDFDAALFDLLQALAHNAVMHLTPNEHRINPTVICKLIRDLKIDYGVFPAPILAELTALTSLKSVITMGAKPQSNLLETLLRYNPKLEINNGYGLTETTVAITNEILEIGSNPNQIGVPYINNQVWILNPVNLRICPFNTAGEIFICGASISESYLVEDQNENRFIWMRQNSPYSFETCDKNATHAQKFFATGDLAYFKKTPKGLTVTYIGRSTRSREVKLGGVFKMDLDAVESVIRNTDLVKDVHLSFNEETGISAYILPHNKLLSTRQIRAEIRKSFLQSDLAMFTCPKAIMKMAYIPKTSNGKVDTEVLGNFVVNDNDQKVTEKSEIQQKIIKVISTCLPKDYVDTIETDLTFEELFHDSIVIIQLKVRIFIEFSIKEDNKNTVIIDGHSTIEGIEKQIKNYLNGKKFLELPEYTHAGDVALRYVPSQKKAESPNTGTTNLSTKFQP